MKLHQKFVKRSLKTKRLEDPAQVKKKKKIGGESALTSLITASPHGFVRGGCLGGGAGGGVGWGRGWGGQPWLREAAAEESRATSLLSLLHSSPRSHPALPQECFSSGPL